MGSGAVRKIGAHAHGVLRKDFPPLVPELLTGIALGSAGEHVGVVPSSLICPLL